jgi:hypothetical protein
MICPIFLYTNPKNDEPVRIECDYMRALQHRQQFNKGTILFHAF